MAGAAGAGVAEAGGTTSAKPQRGVAAGRGESRRVASGRGGARRVIGVGPPGEGRAWASVLDSPALRAGLDAVLGLTLGRRPRGHQRSEAVPFRRRAAESRRLVQE